MMSRKNILLTKSRQISTSSKNLLNRSPSLYSPYSPSLYQPQHLSPSPSSKYPIPHITPQRIPIDRGQYTATRPKQRLANNLNYKIDSIIKHNSYLLDQNNKLTELIREKQMKIQILQEQLKHQLMEEEQGLIIMDQERKRILYDLQENLIQKDEEIRGLMRQIAALKEEIDSRNDKWRVQNIKLKQEFSRDTQLKLDNIKRSQIYNIQIYQAQINKLKSAILTKQQQLQQQQHHHTVKQKKLQQQLRLLHNDIKHQTQKHHLFTEQLKLSHETSLSQLLQEKTHQQELLNSSHENTIKRMKKELIEKTLECERLGFRLEQTTVQNDAEYEWGNQEKMKRDYEREEMEFKNKENMEKEINKREEMNRVERGNMELYHRNYVSSLKGENEKLLEITNIKSAQIDRLTDQISTLKQLHSLQLHSNQQLITSLQTQLHQLTLSHLQQVQLLKVKMSLLHNGDIQGIIKSYDDQINILSQEITRLTSILQETKEKLHEELAAKTEMRKDFEIELGKQCREIMELRVKLEGKRLEMKGSLEDIRSKFDLKSQGMIVEKGDRMKEVGRREEEMKKLYELVEAKDGQIGDLNQMVRRLKQDYEEELKTKREEIQRLKKINDDINNELKKQKQFLQNNLKRKQSQHRIEVQSLEFQLSSLKTTTYSSLLQDLQSLETQKNHLSSQLQKQRLLKQKYHKSDNIQKETIELMKIESSAALEQEKDENRKKVDDGEGKWKRFYMDVVKSKDKEIGELKRRLFEKDEDIREVEGKVAGLEREMRVMMDGVEGLRELERKVMGLGLDAGLVKNMAELFKERRKE